MFGVRRPGAGSSVVTFSTFALSEIRVGGGRALDLFCPACECPGGTNICRGFRGSSVRVKKSEADGYFPVVRGSAVGMGRGAGDGGWNWLSE